MRALVSGGNGFIGSHLVDELVKRDWMWLFLIYMNDVTTPYHLRCILSGEI